MSIFVIATGQEFFRITQLVGDHFQQSSRQKSGGMGRMGKKADCPKTTFLLNYLALSNKEACILAREPLGQIECVP